MPALVGCKTRIPTSSKDHVDRGSLDDWLKDILFPRPKSPPQSLAVTYARPGFQVELTAAEPLVIDPIAMAWGPDGRLWVVEMGDYPLGLDGKGKPGGAVRCLEDSTAMAATTNRPCFSTVSVFRPAWCLAQAASSSLRPDIIYAEDTDGDGKADKQRGPVPRLRARQSAASRQRPDVGSRQLALLRQRRRAAAARSKLREDRRQGGHQRPRFPHPARHRALDPQSGQSQFGRNRDDWGNWFGC